MIRAVAGVLVVVALAALTGCTPASRADARAEQVAREIADALTPRSPEALDAEYYAERALAVVPSDATVRVETLGWSGRVDVDAEAVVTLRITVDLPEGSDSGFIPGEPASSTVRCWDLVIRHRYDYDPGASELRGIPCPEDAPALTPAPEPLATMPPDVEPRLAAVLADATPADAEELVRAEFPEPGWSVVVEERDGVLAVALGTVYQGVSCAVGVRHPDGSVEVLQGFSPESLLPGEIGCHPMLYFGGYSPGAG